MANSKKRWIEYHLNDLFMINPNKEILPDNTDVSFVAMKDISDDGYIISAESKNFADVKNGYTYFKNNDVILAKITPCFENGKMAVVSNLINNYGAGSTEFFVFRKLPNAPVLPKILYYSFKTSKFRENAISHMSGAAGQKRVPKKFLEHYPLYIPPTIEEQQEIVDVLDAASQIIRLRTACIESAQSIIPALFQEMFGDLEHDTTLNTLISLEYGKALKAEDRNNDGEYPVYGSNGIVGYHDSYIVEGQTIIVGRKGSCGKLNLTQKSCYPIDTCFYIKQKINIDWTYLFYALQELNVENMLKDAVIPGINRNDYLRNKIRLASEPQQKLFAAKVQEIEAYIKTQQAELENAKTMFQFLLHHSFTGELTRHKFGGDANG